MRGTLAERFWSKVKKGSGPNACWLWTASCDTKGYGLIGTGERSERLQKAHRVSWELHNGPIPVGLNVFHRCTNNACVRPEHLFVARHLPGHELVVTSELRDLLDGLILGDGWYRKASSIAALFGFGQCPAHRRWVYTVERQLSKFGITTCRGGWGPKISMLHGQKIHSTGMILFNTPNYRSLLPERQRWYPNGKRRIPRTINLDNSRLLANWYMGNGTCYYNHPTLQVSLQTDAYPEEDVQWLREEFEQRLGLHGFVNHTSQARGRKPILSFSKRNTEKFLELVRPYVLVPPFRHKVPLLLGGRYA